MFPTWLPAVWLPPSIPPPSVQEPILSMTAIAHETSAIVWIKWAKSNESLTYEVHTCVRIFSLVDFSFASSATPCGSSISDFLSRNNLMSVHSSGQRGGNLHCWPPITGAGSIWQNVCVDFEVRKHKLRKSVPPCFTRAEPEANHIHSAEGVLPVDFCRTRGEKPLSIPWLPCDLRNHGRTNFQRRCNFADCDPLFPVDGFDHKSTSTPSIVFSAPTSQQHAGRGYYRTDSDADICSK